MVLYNSISYKGHPCDVWFVSVWWEDGSDIPKFSNRLGPLPHIEKLVKFLQGM